MIEAIVFDIDGVLVDTQKYHYLALNKALLDHGLPQIIYQDHLDIFNGLPTREKLKMLDISDNLKKSISDKKQKYTQELLGEISYNSRTFHILKYFSNYYKLGVGTNCIKLTSDIILTCLKLNEFLGCVINNEDVVNPKPAPDIYLECANRLKVNTKDVLVCEDSVYGMKAVLNAGAKLCPVLNPDELTLDRIEHFIKVYS